MKKEIDLNNKTVVISRTDSIGDVILTLPMCSWLKRKFPKIKIVFLGNTYTKPILQCHTAIDEIISLAELEELPVPNRVETLKSLNADVFIHVFPNRDLAKIAKRAKIPVRIGTSHRSYHLLTCNVRPNFTRKKSDYHESQLNFELLREYGLTDLPSLDELKSYNTDFQSPEFNNEEFKNVFKTDKQLIILHAKSQGSALEWGMDNFKRLATLLLENGYAVACTGTETEGRLVRPYIKNLDVLDTTGKLTLSELIGFIGNSHALVACSTGPLHIAAIQNKIAVGLYSPKRPIHPGRWQPIGDKALALVNDDNCLECASKKKCNCIELISPERVLEQIKNG